MSEGTTPAVVAVAERDAKINPPEIYDGNRKNFKRFWQQVELYIMGAPKQFPSDGQKIAFVLSYLRKGDADSWAESFQTQKAEEAKKSGKSLEFGSWTEFQNEITEAFQSLDAQKDALSDLNQLYLDKKSTAEDHVARFKTLVVKAELKEEKDLITKFQQSLPHRMRRIIAFQKEPTTLKEWYEAAIKVDNLERRLNEDLARQPSRYGGNFQMQQQRSFKTPNSFRPSGTPKTYIPPRSRPPPYRDPNAMDVDAISTEEREKLMKAGKCFICKEVGHMAREHRNPNFKPRTNTNRTPNYQPRTIAQQIRSMNPAEQAQIYRETFGAEEEREEEEAEPTFGN